MTTLDRYEEIVARKIHHAKEAGFDGAEMIKKFKFPKGAKPFPFQIWLILWALRVGRAAIFAECGLGKTPMQLVWAWCVAKFTGGNVLILCPLAVAAQTVREGEKFGIKVNPCKTAADIKPGINITNYEKLEHFDACEFIGVVLDESSIIKSFTSKTKTQLCERFKDTLYKLCCTATPAPNEHDELGNHSEFLGWMSNAQMRATWFINDTMNTGDWRLKKHARTDFWRWVASWAACVSKPSEIGFSDEGYGLPKLTVQQHTVEVDYSEERADGELFRIATLSATTMHKEKRLTLTERCAKLAEIVSAEPNEKWLIWCDLNDEQDELEKLFGDKCVSIRGGAKDSDILKWEHDWRCGDVQIMLSKGEIFGFGMNWQHCARVGYVSINYSFEKFYQTLRRSWRFGQTREVFCHITAAESEGPIIQTIKRKIEQHEEMKKEMKIAAKEIVKGKKKEKVCSDKLIVATGESWRMTNGDCVRGMAAMPAESIHFSVWSPPFVDLFTYSEDLQDHGNCKTMEEFMEAFDFVVSEVFRTTMPGRLCAVHCLDLMSAKWKEGFIGLKNFSGAIVDAFMDKGWLFHSRVTIWKDPVTEMQRTKALGLLHKQLLKDSSMSRVGNAEYLCVFRKPGENPIPISHERDEYPVELWQRDASPVWMDVRQTEVLNGHGGREVNDERHICPLQLDVIERAIRLWSNKGETVLSPYGGIGSEGYQAILMGRKYIGFELKPSYWKEAQKYLAKAEMEASSKFEFMK